MKTAHGVNSRKVTVFVRFESWTLLQVSAVVQGNILT